jgi:hypothetical protein
VTGKPGIVSGLKITRICANFTCRRVILRARVNVNDPKTLSFQYLFLALRLRQPFRK